MTEKLYTQGEMDAAVQSAINEQQRVGQCSVRTAHARESYLAFEYLLNMSEEPGLWTQKESELIRYCALEIRRDRHRKQADNG